MVGFEKKFERLKSGFRMIFVFEVDISLFCFFEFLWVFDDEVSF